MVKNMKTIKQKEAEMKLRKCYLPHLAGELKALKDVLGLIDELTHDIDGYNGDPRPHIEPKELKKRING